MYNMIYMYVWNEEIRPINVLSPHSYFCHEIFKIFPHSYLTYALAHIFAILLHNKYQSVSYTQVKLFLFDHFTTSSIS